MSQFSDDTEYIKELEAELLSEREKVRELQLAFETSVKSGIKTGEDCYHRGFKDGRAVTGGSKIMPERDEATTEGISADGAVPASEERDRQSPSVLLLSSDYLRGFRDARERAAKAIKEAKHGHGYGMPTSSQMAMKATASMTAYRECEAIVRAIEPGE